MSENYAQAPIPAADPTQIRALADLLWSDGECLELRIVGRKAGSFKEKESYVGYYSDRDALVRDALRFHAKKAVYIGANSRKPELLHAQAANSLAPGAEGGKNEDVARHQWFLLDLDTVRPDKRVAATDAEIEAARPVFEAVQADLGARGITPITADSGNGRHLLLKVTPYRRSPEFSGKEGAIALLLRWFARKFSDQFAEVDVGVFDPARVWKVYGTAAIKGGNTVERPWLTARFDPPGAPPEPVDVIAIYQAEIQEQRELEAKEKAFKQQPGSGSPGAGRGGDVTTLDIVALFKGKELYEGPGGKEGMHRVKCPWAGEHTSGTNGDGSTVVFEAPEGSPPGFKCSHSHCVKRSIKAVLKWFGPEAVDACCAKTRKRERTSSADLALAYLGERGFWPEGPRTFQSYQGDFYRYDVNKYVNVLRSDLKADVIRFLQLHPGTRGLARSQVAHDVIANIEGMVNVTGDTKIPCFLSAAGDSSRLIPLKNGILNLEAVMKGTHDCLTAHTPNFFSLSCLPYDYEPGARADTWQGFLDQMVPCRETQKLLQEWFGYNLIEDTSFHKLLLMVGDGANGKTVICVVLRSLLGPENVSAVTLEQFNPTRTFPLSATFGKLANIVEEIGEMGKTEEGVLKNFVSGGQITIERKHRDPFEFNPTARLTFASNVLPRFSDKTDGIWRRILLIPLRVQILDPKDQDRNLTDPKWWAASGELPGVFNWALEGLLRLRKRGQFTMPESSQNFLDDYRQDSNPAATFLDENCVEDAGKSTSSQWLYSRYSEWVKEAGGKPLAAPQFAKEVQRRFHRVILTAHARRQSGGERSREWTGLDWVTDPKTSG